MALVDLQDPWPKGLGVRVTHINTGSRQMWMDQPPGDPSPSSSAQGPPGKPSDELTPLTPQHGATAHCFTMYRAFTGIKALSLAATF